MRAAASRRSEAAFSPSRFRRLVIGTRGLPLPAHHVERAEHEQEANHHRPNSLTRWLGNQQLGRHDPRGAGQDPTQSPTSQVVKRPHLASVDPTEPSANRSIAERRCRTNENSDDPLIVIGHDDRLAIRELTSSTLRIVSQGRQTARTREVVA
jgi:hypothetical protein